METRVNLRLPLKVRALCESGEPEQDAESVNVSQRGLSFSSAVPIAVGMRVEILMTMPQEITGNPPTDVRCTGRAVHVQPPEISGRASIGVRIERYEPVAQKEAWAN
jgi:hypothetical protein